MIEPTPKNFADWETSAFGYGYGNGEAHILPALKAFFAAVGQDEMPDRSHSYDYEKLEAALTPVVAWLLINILCREGLIEYGSSPRFGWLTAEGIRLQSFVNARTGDDLYRMTRRDEGDVGCYPDACNCGDDGYVEGRKCPNPFWPAKRKG